MGSLVGSPVPMSLVRVELRVLCQGMGSEIMVCLRVALGGTGRKPTKKGCGNGPGVEGVNLLRGGGPCWRVLPTNLRGTKS